MPVNMNLAQKVATYIRLRDHKEDATRELKKSMERVNQAMEKLEGEILEELHASGSTSQSSEFGTVFIATMTNMKTANRDEFLRYCIQNRDLDLMDIRVNRTAMKEKMANGEHVDGVDVTSTQVIRVRKGKK